MTQKRSSILYYTHLKTVIIIRLIEYVPLPQVWKKFLEHTKKKSMFCVIVYSVNCITGLKSVFALHRLIYILSHFFSGNQNQIETKGRISVSPLYITNDDLPFLV